MRFSCIFHTLPIKLCFLILLFFDLPISSSHPQQPKTTRHRKTVPQPQPYSLNRDTKPNIILILTDDQDIELGSLLFMNKTLTNVKRQGAEFRHAYVTTPMCCPSRSSLLTGMYVHNHNIYTNNDNCSGTVWQATHETRSFATYLSNAGYRTGYFGKYLNKYNGSYIPPGWREWGGLIMNSKYYNYSINMNGKKIKHGCDYHKDYYPDLIANDSIAFLRQSKKNNPSKPVMLTMSFPSPHGPEDSAPQYSHMFLNVTKHHTPSYDHAPNTDKQWILKVTKKMLPIHKEFTNLLMAKRLQTLMSVDDAVERVVKELEALNQLDNTYVIYTSDHGYHLGQFGLIKGKSFPFEFDVRVPLLVRGPGIEPGRDIDEIVLNIDLAPTFLDMAGVKPPPHMDGRSLLPLLKSRKKIKWPDTFLIESSGRREHPSLLKKHLLTTTELPPGTYSPYGASFMPTSTVFDVSTASPSVPAQQLVTSSRTLDSSSEELTDNGEDEDIRDEVEDDLDDEVEDDVDPKVLNNTQIISNDYIEDERNKLTKSEKLAKECPRLTIQACSFNQKWYCEFDDEKQKYRKRKCRSFPPRTYRSCACFSAQQLKYKKIPIGTRSVQYRIQKDKQIDKIVSRLLDDSIKIRAKRDALTQDIEDTMNLVKNDINTLQAINSSQLEHLSPVSLDTNTIPDLKTGCSLIGIAQVNCSTEILYNRKMWLQSKHRINSEIQILKDRLEKLKAFRKHLKSYPPNEHVFENTSSNRTNLRSPEGDQSQNQFINFYSEKPMFRKNKQMLLQNNQYQRTSFDQVPVNKSNHYRHQHHKNHVSTKGYNNSDLDIATTRALRISTAAPKDEGEEQPQTCHCESIEELEREARRRFKEEKLRKKQRKQKKREQMEKECLAERMNCFHHDNDHWKTAPLWTAGPFCFCMNANNNTYSCVRTINSTHNFLYCEFTTGFITYYNLRMDPFELTNRADQMKPEEKSYLHNQLMALMVCRGHSCTVTHTSHNQSKSRRNSTTFLGNYKQKPNSAKGLGEDVFNEEFAEKPKTATSPLTNSRKRRKFVN